MKNICLSLILTFALTSNLFSQNNYERCGFNNVVDYYETINPGFKTISEGIYQESLQSVKQKTSAREFTDYNIPVVVHVVYSGDEQNIHDSVIHNQIRILNQDFTRSNPDTVNLRDTFKTVAANPGVRFWLAAYDPNGDPTTGITRTYTTELFGEGGGFFGPDISEIEDVKITANGGIDPWDPTKYLNIWVCDMSAGGEASLLGYATPPANLDNWPDGSTDGMTDGVVIQYQCFGSNNPNDLIVQGSNIDVLGRTVTHEVGHYLGLRHTAEQSWFGGSCGDDDGLKDTPNCEQSAFDCSTLRNSCVDTIINLDGDTLGDLYDMVENYMDYSDEACQNSFTFGQAGIIKDVMENHRDGLLDNGKLTGVKAIKKNTPIVTVYPNPSDGKFELNFSNNEVSSVEIYDELGKLILQRFSDGLNFMSVDLSNRPRGVYYMKLTGQNPIKVKKLVLN